MSKTSKKERMDKLGSRMKSYESIETMQKFPPNSILCVRIDGRSFSKFTRGLARPYDTRLSTLMIETMKYIVEEHKCLIGYTQSDELNFVLLNKYEALCDFDAKKQKLISAMASSATAYFNAHLSEYIPEKVGGVLPRFDCRIWAVPSEAEASNAILWREQDAIKNSISMLAQHHFSHKELQGVNTGLMKDMLLTQRDIRWDDQPKFFKSGTYAKRELYIKSIPDGTGGLEGGSTCVRSRIGVVDAVIGDLSLEDRVNFIFGDKNVTE